MQKQDKLRTEINKTSKSVIEEMKAEVNETHGMWNREIRAAVFDVDGTLLDSMPVWNDIGELYLRSIGIAARKGLGETLHTMSLEQGAAYLKKEYRLEEQVPEIVEEVLKIVEDFYRRKAPLKAGVKETLEWLKQKQVRMVVATSGNRQLVEAALERTGISGYFEKIFTCTEIGAGKDEPRIYLETARFLESRPEEILVFEDALHAAETAKKAGFVVIGVYDDSNKENIFRMKQICDRYLDRMDLFVAEKTGNNKR